MSDCPTGCGRPRHQDWAICSVCANGLRQDLAELPALCVELDRSLARLGSNYLGGGKANGDPLPYGLGASRATGDIKAVLVAWVRDLDEDPEHHPADTIPAMSGWLLARHAMLVVHPAAEEVCREFAGITRRARHATDPNRRGRIDLPDPCPEDACAAPLYATLHDVGDPRPNLVWCREGHEWRPEQWLRLGHRLGYSAGGAA